VIFVTDPCLELEMVDEDSRSDLQSASSRPKPHDPSQCLAFFLQLPKFLPFNDISRKHG